MAVNFTLLTAAAPYIIDAANKIISLVNKNKEEKNLQDKVLSIDEKLAVYEKRQAELLTINEKQSQVIKDLAEQNQKLILAVRNTRLAAIVALGLGMAGVILALAL
jgi:hypothetical protein